MRLLAIDPGPTESAWMMLEDGEPDAWAKEPNDMVKWRVGDGGYDALAIELVQSFGMAVGAETFETVLWAGRFIERAEADLHRVYRSEVKLHLCHNMRAKDANIRQALIDRFGGKEAAIGRKANKGPLYGITKDCWSALAVGITAIETKIQRKEPA